ncbi:MAG: hypothetical protein M0R06_18900 [Sphaerochaeta sp.]|nr:hypothetical protein [Sphaerochaeta sp.]
MLPDWYCLLSVAADVDEARRYERYLLAGGDPKKYKHPAAPLPTKAKSSNPFEIVMGALKRSGMNPETKGQRLSPEEYARARGIKKVYRDVETGAMFDENGNPVTPNPGQAFVPISKGG